MQIFDPRNFLGLTFGSKKTPTYSTGISEAARGQQYRIGYWANPLFQIHCEIEMLRDPGYRADGFPYDERNALQGFFMARRGSLEDFLWYDPDDNTVTDGVIPMVQSPTGWISPLQSLIGTGISDPATMDITDLVPNAAPSGADLDISDNGTLQTLGTDYSFDPTIEGVAIPVVDAAGNIVSATSYDGIYVSWLHPPTGPVTASFQYYFRVHFANYQGAQRSQSGVLDAMELTKIFNRMWEAKTIEMETSRP